jgi:regulator of sigma E protease
MEVFLIKALQFILAISLLVLLHEGGHFFFSKLFGVRVNKFYVFFDWKFSLWKKKIGETEYGIGWIPLGGYCQIEGMIDETQHDLDKMKAPAQPWEFRSKPAWQRLLIMVGGVLVNFLLALFIYAMVLFVWGDSYIATKDMTHGMKFNTEAKALGFHDGDIMLGTENGDFKQFDADLYRELAVATECRVLRDGKQVTVKLPGDMDLLHMLKTVPSFVRPLVPAEVDSVLADSPAMKAGMRKGDTILALDGQAVDSWNELNELLGKRAEGLVDARTSSDSVAMRTAQVVFMHRNGTAADTATVVLTPEMKFGVGMTSIYSYYEPTKLEYGFFESFPAGVKYGMNVLGGYVGDLKYLFSSDGAKSLGGFGTIGNLFPPVWDWHLFWLMTAFLSIILAFMNILPIPVLDGGHVLFLLYEMITRRKPSDKFMLYAEYVGLGILLLLLVVANLNDILRWIGLM